MNIEWNKVTWYSKLLAVILFLATFGIAFKLGVLYKEVQILNAEVKNEQNLLNDKISRDFSLKIGAERTLGPIKIKLVDVTSDSRCPKDVQCIWEGTLVTEINLTAEGQTVEKEINLGKETRFLGYVISIKGVTPEKVSNSSISKENYVIDFHIEK